MPKNRKNKLHDQEFRDQLWGNTAGSLVVATGDMAADVGVVFKIKELAGGINSLGRGTEFVGEV